MSPTLLQTQMDHSRLSRGERPPGRRARSSRPGWGASAFALALLVVVSPARLQARPLTSVSELRVAEQGDVTVIRLQTSSKPMFSVFKIERPLRLNVDLANSHFEGVAGITDVDSWAVGQVATTEFQTHGAPIARLMIGFRRPVQYAVRTEDRTVIISVTPEQPRPKTDPARMSQELSSARQEVAKAKEAESSARKKAEEERRSASSAMAAAERAQQEARQARTETEAARAQSAAALADHQQQVIRLRAELERARTRANQETAGKEAEAQAARLRVKELEAKLAQASAMVRQAEATKGSSKEQLAEAEGRRAAAERARHAAELALQEARKGQEQAESARLSAEESRRASESARRAAEQQLKQEAKRRLAAEKAQRESEARVAVLAKASQEVQARRAKLDQVSERATRLEQALSEARARESQQQQAIGLAQQQAEEGRRQAQQARQAYAQLSARMTGEERRAAELAKDMARVRRELEQQRAVAAEAAAQVERSREEARRAREKLAQQTDHNARQVAQHEVQQADARLKRAEASRLSAEQSRERLLTDMRSNESHQRAAAAELRRVQSGLADARQRAKDATEQVTEAERKLADNRKQLESIRKARQTEEARRQAAELARRAEESRLQQADRRREAAEKERDSAQRRLIEVNQALAKATQARLAEEQRLSRLQRPAKAVAAPQQPAASEPVRVQDIRFVDGRSAAQVQVVLTGTASHRLVRRSGATTLVLEGVTLPRILQRTLDATEYRGPVEQITSYASPQSKTTALIRVTLKDPTATSRLRQDGHLLTWEFSKAASARGTQLAGAPSHGSAEDSFSYKPHQVAGARVQRGARTTKSYSGRRIDLDFKDADIQNILRLLSDVGNVNIITSDNVGGRVTIRMKNVPWDQAMDVILRTKGLGQVREGNLIRVAPLTDLEKEREAEIARLKQEVLLRPLETRLIPLSYARANTLLDKLRGTLSPRGVLSVDMRTNMIVARDIARNLDLAEQLARALDLQTPQVLIEARIVEARTNYSKEIGIQWGGSFLASQETGNATGLVFPSTLGFAGGATDGSAPLAGLTPTPANPAFAVNLPASTGTGRGGALGLTLGSVSGAVNVNLRLSAAEATGDIRIVSAPKITTLDNVEATIEQGTTIPFSQVSAAGVQTTFMDAKLNLTVRPHVTADGSIVMKVQVTRNEPDFANTGARGEPTILKKEARTEMLVRDGDTAVIGGIYVTRTGRTFAKVPWFADIPVIGWLFKTRKDTSDREEVLVFITPRIINRAQSIGR